MYIRLYSDIHNEMRRPMPFRNSNDPVVQYNRLYQWQPPKLATDKDTVLVLAGDIDNAKQIPNFLNGMADQFLAIVHVPGNHEYYGREFYKSNALMTQGLKPNVHVLIDDTCVIEGQRFVGSTMWGFIPRDPVAEQVVQWAMNDFNYIDFKKGGTKLKVQDVQQLHKQASQFLEENVMEGDVVVTHHMPVRPDRAVHHDLDYAYYADKTELITNAKPALWLYGHTHQPRELLVSYTRVVHRPVGYEFEYCEVDHSLLEI